MHSVTVRVAWLVGLAALVALSSCGPEGSTVPPESDVVLPESEVVLDLSWSRVLERAKGQELTLAMWTGDPLINSHVRGWIAPNLRDRFGIQLNVVSAQGNEIVDWLLAESEAGKEESELDLVWIGGETFYRLRQMDALLGPFVTKLPSAQYVDYQDPFIRRDAQQLIAGYEAPWGTVQLALIYDSERVDIPPRTRGELAAWVKAHPDRFTFDTSFTGMTFLRSLLIDVGGPKSFQGPFNEELYEKASGELFAYLREIQPFLWRAGRTFPAHVTELHQLFVGGEVDFTMSHHDGEVDNKVSHGLLPESSRAYVLDSGTIRNSHYLGLVRRGTSLAAALVAVDFLQSPEAQYEKLKPEVWGDGTVLNIELLPEELRAKFHNVSQRIRAPQREEIRHRALQEPSPEVMIRLVNDFRQEILGQ